MNEITQWSAVETAKRIRSRDVSCKETVEAHLAQIDACNPSLNAIVQFADDCVSTATKLDNETSSSGQALYGVPVTIKSNIDQSGFSSPNGIAAFNSHICTADSPLVNNLKGSGAIILGRTNTPEFSLRWSTSNPLFGTTANPWNSSITPGGSSGGAAASVAVGMGCIAHGNDLGGSLRYPAYCCGVTTIRPSLGRVPAFNPSMQTERPPITQTMSVQGPIARSVADVKLALQVMSQRSSDDPLWQGSSNSQRRRESSLRIAYCTNPFPDGVDAEVEKAMEIAIAGLRECGANLIECAPPKAQEIALLWGQLLFTESKFLLNDTINEHGSDKINQVLSAYGEHFGQLDLPGFISGLAQRIYYQRLWSQWFDQYDLLLMPTSLLKPCANDLDFNQPESIPSLLNAQKPLYIINLLGLPAAAIPTHVDNNVPLGVQLVGPMYDDYYVLDIAQKLETVIGQFKPQHFLDQYIPSS